jgi:hypothetical protein
MLSNNEAAKLHAHRHGARELAIMLVCNSFGTAMQLLHDDRQIAVERHRSENFLRIDGRRRLRRDRRGAANARLSAGATL